MPFVRQLTPLAVLVAVAVAFVVLPIASSAFLGDDQFNSTVNGALRESGLSINELAWRTTLGFFQQTSRFLPGFYFQAYGLFHYFPGLAEYKAIQIALYGIDFILFAVLLRLLGLGTALTSAAVLLSLTAIQFYGHFDYYLGFSATAAYLLLLTFGSWIAFAAWLRNAEGNWGRAVAVLLFAFSVLNYETMYPMSLGHLLIAVHLRGRAAWRDAWMFLAVTAAALAQIFVARMLYPQATTDTYSLHLISLAYFRTVFYQVTASLPLMHLAFFRDAMFPPGTPFWSAVPWWLLTCVAAISGIAAFLAFRALGSLPVRKLVLPAALGLWLWIEAAVLLAAIPRYQIEVQPGHGYGPMALAGFGAAIVLTCALAALAARVPQHRRTAVAAGLAALYALVLTASFETNQRTLAIYEGERAALINLVAALDDGVASTVPDGATLLAASPLAIMNRYDAMSQNTGGLDNPRFFVREHTGRALRVRSLWEKPNALACERDTCVVDRTYGLYDVPIDVRDGYTAVGRVSRVARLGDGTLQPWADDVYVHVRGARIADLSEHARIVVAYACRSGGGERRTPLSALPPAIRRGTIIRLPADCLVNLTSVKLAQLPS